MVPVGGRFGDGWGTTGTSLAGMNTTVKRLDLGNGLVDKALGV